ncbi:disease resistance protein [Populus alba x Populus x berolinensis]|uniref:Disease resistance protein n=2 Tax=Populus TaxID=3689 RepID=A0AAD6LDR3_9ROSI|nr:putative disease resistance protein At1g50180 [Populus alba]KAJ6863783.1 disease resistance protein [Populus alba x Populus x berolinensis]KAJ6958529.1 disease resistance protein [Populus alba x Populus x berolinensis]TKR85300.1 putative disease resistance protein [Populus alba]
MAESAVSTVVQRLGDLLIQEAVFLDGVNEEAYGMQVELQRMQSFLRDADRRQDEEESVKNWVSEIRETAYDVEDIIEEFALKVALRRRSGMVNVMKRYATLAKETIELHNVGNEIQIIKNRISSLTNSLQTYGIIQRNDDWIPGLGRQQQQLRRSYSHIVEEDIVGLEEDVKVLAEQLVNSNGIVSICGMGGIGKTTLAKKVYHNSKVRHHFDAFAWAYVSQQCQVREVWEGILFKLTNPSKEQREEIANLRDEELVKRLYQVQLQKKCLVILDDIWTIPTWNNLCPAFPYWKTAGSKILLTTRKMDVALHPDPTCFLHVPPQLNDDESWELFKKKACVDNNYPDVRTRAEIERLGREMVGRCTGLPLAIIVLGGLLATKKTIFEWDVVRQNIISHLRRGKGDEQLLGVTEVLALSYHELPYQLKPCFLHLAHFPEDCEIQTKKMIRMWVAEGFVSSVYNGVEEETMEDVAQRYLGELVERCMVQVVERGITGRIRTCRMHDLMRDLCVSKAKQENFLEVFNQSLASDHSADSFPRSTVREARSIGRLRRLAVVLEGDLHKFIPSGYKRNSHLRSLLYFHEKACHAENWGSIKSVFKNFKLLRVLDLEGIQSHGGKLAKEIGNLIHLRFLSLRDTDIDELPSTIGNLRYLQTLDLLTWNSTVQIPNVVWRLNRLRHLYLPESCGEDSYKWQLANLVNLQTLVNFPAEKCEITDLVRLNHLKKLVIDDPKFGAIFRSPHVRFYRLQSLSFVSNEDSTVVQVIQGCPNLYKLHIEGQIEKLPECQQFSANLAKLNLLGSKLTEDPMPTLEKLPNLRILRLQMDSFLGNKMVCLDKGFPQLKSLFLYDLPNLEEWEVVEGAMANLFHLEISNCTSLKTVPEGLRFITSLREMEIRSMLKAFRTRLEHGGEDYYKVQHVPSIAFRYCDY